jgi:hypothetical protein
MKRIDAAQLLKIILLFVLFVSGNSSLFSQSYNGGPRYNDAQLWQNIYFEKNLTQKVNIHINEEGRITENITLPSYIYLDLGITYKPKKYLHFTIAYVPIANRLRTDFISYRHQFYFDVVVKMKFHHFVFYDRQMVQMQYNDINRAKNWEIPSYYLRNKVTVKYKSGESRYIPYIAAELYYQINANQYNGMQSDRMRYYAGCFYELDKVNQLELYYLMEPHYNIPASFTNFVIGIGYAHNLY